MHSIKKKAANFNFQHNMMHGSASLAAWLGLHGAVPNLHQLH
jgi:hypothetical protein